MKKIIIAEIGTNSLKLFKAHNANGKLAVLQDVNVSTRLGKNLYSTNTLCAKAKQLIVSSISSFLKNNETEDEDFYIIATQGLRQATDSEHFINKLYSEFKVKTQIIAFEEESYLSYIAAKSELGFECSIFDSGGGSTDLYFPKNQKNINFEIGAVNLTSILASQKFTTKQAIDFLQTNYFNKLKCFKTVNIVGIGGSAVTIASVFDSTFANKSITIEELNRQINLYSSLSNDEIKNIKGLKANRSEIILAGSLIIKALLLSLNLNKYTICLSGLRHGFALKKLSLS